MAFIRRGTPLHGMREGKGAEPWPKHKSICTASWRVAVQIRAGLPQPRVAARMEAGLLCAQAAARIRAGPFCAKGLDVVRMHG